MKRINEDSYLLSTGKEISPKCGIIGLKEVSGFGIFEGYDGQLNIEDKEGLFQHDITKEEAKEIALYMVEMWKRFICTLN